MNPKSIISYGLHFSVQVTTAAVMSSAIFWTFVGTAVTLEHFHKKLIRSNTKISTQNKKS